jgi:hypothetical protein
MSYDNLSSVSQNVLKFYQQLTGEERRIPFIFDDFYFCRSRVIGLDMTENMIFTICRMITWLVVSQNVLKFYQQLASEERRIPFIFDDFHFCRSRVFALDMIENRIFTLCHMITWVVFLSRLSSVNFSHFNLLLWNPSAKWTETWLEASMEGPL